MPAESEQRPGQPKETSKGLPMVEKSTVTSMWQNFTTRENWGDNLQRVKQRMLDENPELVKFIESQVGKFPSPLHLPIFEVIVATIAVLENQAEANKLSSEYMPDGPDSS